MTPDELARELADLDRFSPPAVDPALLLHLETRASGLTEENTELRQTIAQNEARIAELLSSVEQRKAELSALKISQQKREKEWEEQLAEWRRKQQYWSSIAVTERADVRSRRTQWIQSVGLAVAGIGVCLGCWIAGERYWTFTQDEQLRMMQTAARDKAEAVTAYRNANRELAEVKRLRNQMRRVKRPAAAQQDMAEKAATGNGEQGGEREKESPR